MRFARRSRGAAESEARGLVPRPKTGAPQRKTDTKTGFQTMASAASNGDLTASGSFWHNGTTKSYAVFAQVKGPFQKTTREAR